MRIATMVTGYIPLPRPTDMVYAPMDLAVTISEGLAARGHDVHFYAPEGTKLSVPVKTLGLRPLELNRKQFMAFLGTRNETIHKLHYLWDQYLASEMFRLAQAGQYDVLYFHHPDKALGLARYCPDVPVVYTIHDPLNKENCEIFDMFASPNQHYVSISDAQRMPAPNLNYIDTIYNGVDVNTFSYSATHDNYLLIANRIVPEKGIREAIQIAKATNNKLLIIGSVYPTSEKYFNEFIKPELNDQIQYLGFKEREHIMPYFQKAKALLMPISWEEPFGMVMIEAMASGTPVVGTRRGSIPEVVEHGKTGFIGDSVEDLITAVKNIDLIKRSDCRKHVEDNFSNENMVLGYEKAFRAAYEKTRPHQALANRLASAE